jgi:hypothetical protein
MRTFDLHIISHVADHANPFGLKHMVVATFLFRWGLGRRSRPKIPSFARCRAAKPHGNEQK